jgi:hypothetical protein
MREFTTVNQVETFLELEGFEFRKSNFHCPLRNQTTQRWHIMLNGQYQEVSDIVSWANSTLLPTAIK